MSKYTDKWVQAIKQAYPDEQHLAAIVDKIYEEGNEDGIKETCDLF